MKNKLIYLNNAATSFPKPEKVKDAVLAALDAPACVGRGSGKSTTEAEGVLLKTRDQIAKFFNAPSVNKIIFTQNCTEGLNYAIKGVLKEGDHVIIDNTSHNSIARPLTTLEKDGFITISPVNPKEDFYFDPKEIKSLITKKTKLVALSHASNVFGVIQDLKSIGEVVQDTDCLFLVDAAQSAGQIKINMQEMNIDFLATSGHKSLLGPTGTGILCISDKVKELKTIKEGGTGSQSEVLTQPKEFPSILETGTHNVIGITGLLAAIEFIQEEGLEKIRNHEIRLTQYLIDELKKIPGVKVYGKLNASLICSVVSITLDNLNVAECGTILADSFNIITRSGLHCAPLAHSFLGTLKSRGTLRISPGYFNTMDDINAVVIAIKEIVSEKVLV